MLISRTINIETLVKAGKTLLILGPRRVGKTTLVEEFVKESRQRIVVYNGDNLSTQEKFSVNDIINLSVLVDGYEILVIDEAQNIANIGQSLKILNDQKPELVIVATGSSSFTLRGQVGEPLVGRKTTIYLYPLALSEILRGRPDSPDLLVWEELQEQLLIYGFYPNSVLAENNQERVRFLQELVDSLLLKDILRFQEVKGSDVLVKLLRLLAFQVGNEVSLEELGRSLGISKNTVLRYLDLLEKSYIIFRLGGLSRNLRSEISKMSKYYFYDVGVRNALINNFNPPELRDDMGAIWENFAIVERMKVRSYRGDYANQYFWRTWRKSEIDLVEEKDGKFEGFEFKWGLDKEVKLPKEWRETYGDIRFETITPKTLLGWVT